MKITHKEWNKLNSRLKGVERLASTHDPDLVKRLKEIERRIVTLFADSVIHERRLDRIGAPQYRRG
jgi:hypothetical protein